MPVNDVNRITAPRRGHRRQYGLAFAIWLLAFVKMGAVSAEVLIGFANPLTGPYVLSGKRNQVAVEMALGDLNAAGGVLGEKARLISVDDGCGLEKALAAARRMVEAGVSLVVGHMCSHSSLLAAGIYETADVLMITPSSTHPRLTEEGRRNVFRLIGRDDRQGRLAGDLLANRWTESRIGIVHDGTTYGEGLAREARERLRASGVEEVVYDSYTPGRDDYSAFVSKLRRAGIDVLYVGGYGREAGLIVRSAREQGDPLQLVGGDGLGMTEFWAAASVHGEGTIFSDRPDPGSRPETAGILAQLDGAGLGAYAAVEVWAQAVERASSKELEPVADLLRRGKFTSVLGEITFDGKGDLEDASWQWKAWSKGSYAPLEELPRGTGSGVALGKEDWASTKQRCEREAGSCREKATAG